MTSPTGPRWTLKPGDRTTRAEISAFGGSSQGGIVPSATTPNIFVFSDPARGRQHGYSDGWAADHPDVFLYAGEGQRGDQRMRAGNKALLEHASAGRALRLFVADGTLQGTGVKRQLYLGEFALDTDRPVSRQEAPETGGGPLRTIIVFRLRPVSTVLQREADHALVDDVPAATSSQVVGLEAANAVEYSVGGSAPNTAVRTEAALVQRYSNHLTAQGHELGRNRIRPAGELHTQFSDLFDITAQELYEAKGTGTRQQVRQAIGQLLDYRRHIHPAPQSSTVLLPLRPADDLLALLEVLNIGCVYEETGGSWVRVAAT